MWLILLVHSLFSGEPGSGVVEGLAGGIVDEFDDVAVGVADVDAAGAVAVDVDGFAGFFGGDFEGGEIDAECVVGRVLAGGDECEFALADAEEAPGFVGVEDFGVEVFDVEFDGGGDVGGGDGDVVEFEHRFISQIFGRVPT